MGLTVSIVKQDVLGSTYSIIADLLISRYATGGVDLSTADFHMSDALGVQYVGAQAADGVVFDYDPGTAKLIAYDAQGTEVADSTDLSSAPIRAHVLIG